MKAFISAPYTKKSSNQNSPHKGQIVDTAFINFLNSIDSLVRSFGIETFFPHRDLHHWGKTKLSEEYIGKKSLEEIKKSDLMIAYPEESVGVNIELGWASVLKKQVIILINENENVSMMYPALNGITNAHIVKFRDITDLREKLKEKLQNANLPAL